MAQKKRVVDYMRVFDKKEQKYIEGLDQIVDSVI